MKKTVIKGSLSVVLLMFLTSFGADTSRPDHRTIWQRIQAARAERQKKRAERHVTLKLIEYRVEKNDSIIKEMVAEKLDTTKTE